jgi:predicted transcriptional regulator
MEKTPKDLAKQLGISDRTIRTYLRNQYRPGGEDRHSRWKLDEEMVADVERYFGRS